MGPHCCVVVYSAPVAHIPASSRPFHHLRLLTHACNDLRITTSPVLDPFLVIWICGIWNVPATSSVPAVLTLAFVDLLIWDVRLHHYLTRVTPRTRRLPHTTTARSTGDAPLLPFTRLRLHCAVAFYAYVRTHCYVPHTPHRYLTFGCIGRSLFIHSPLIYRLIRRPTLRCYVPRLFVADVHLHRAHHTSSPLPFPVAHVRVPGLPVTLRYTPPLYAFPAPQRLVVASLPPHGLPRLRSLPTLPGRYGSRLHDFGFSRYTVYGCYRTHA